MTIIILGSLCGLRSVSHIHEWAAAEHVTQYLKEKIHIKKLPSYYWLTHLLGLCKPESRGDCFISWMESLLSEGLEGLTISFDKKTVRSAGKGKKAKPLHIVSAHVGNLRLTIGQVAVKEKAMRFLQSGSSYPCSNSMGVWSLPMR